MFAIDLVLLIVAWAHVLLAPYTKVEESFNLHATHDVFFYGVSPSALKHVRRAREPLRRYIDRLFGTVFSNSMIISYSLELFRDHLLEVCCWHGLLDRSSRF